MICRVCVETAVCLARQAGPAAKGRRALEDLTGLQAQGAGPAQEASTSARKR